MALFRPNKVSSSGRTRGDETPDSAESAAKTLSAVMGFDLFGQYLGGALGDGARVSALAARKPAGRQDRIYRIILPVGKHCPVELRHLLRESGEYGASALVLRGATGGNISYVVTAHQLFGLEATNRICRDGNGGMGRDEARRVASYFMARLGMSYVKACSGIFERTGIVNRERYLRGLAGRIADRLDSGERTLGVSRLVLEAGREDPRIDDLIDRVANEVRRAHESLNNPDVEKRLDATPSSAKRAVRPTSDHSL